MMHSSLYISNFSVDGDRRMRRVKIIIWLKRSIKIVVFFILCFWGVKLLNYGYVREDDWSRIMLHHFYEDNGEIDNLYLGSSHVFFSLNPKILDNLTEQYNFNLSSSGQGLNGSYYLLKEANKKNNLSHVYLELYYRVSVEGYYEATENKKYIWYNTDNMPLSVNKWCYAWSAGGAEGVLETWLPFVRYRTYLNDYNYITETIANKEKKDFKEYRFMVDFADGNGEAEYRKQGYQYATRIFRNEDRIYVDDTINKAPMCKKAQEYLQEIIKYCKKNDISITLFVSPMDNLQLISTTNYDYYVEQVREIAEEYQVDFYDFNLAKEEYLPIYEEQGFYDVGHLNAKGAEMFTPFFYQIVTGDKEKNKQFFYNSYSEKLLNMEPSVYGLCYTDSETSDDLLEQRCFSIASNRSQGMEYRIIITPEDEKQYMLQDFNENGQFSLPKEEHGTISVVSRMKNEPNDVNTLEVKY